MFIITTAVGLRKSASRRRGGRVVESCTNGLADGALLTVASDLLSPSVEVDAGVALDTTVKPLVIDMAGR
jgi:hypothetical protein